MAAGEICHLLRQRKRGLLLLGEGARRLLPRGASLPKLGEARVIQGDRLDLIAARTLGDPEQYWRVCDAADALDPADLVQPGRTLTIPMPQP